MKKYYKDYKLDSVHRNGKTIQKLEYTGKHYISKRSTTQLKKKKVFCLSLTLCSFIVMTGIGLINTSGNRVLYVALPYVSLFLPAVFCFLGAVHFMSGDNRLEYAAYDKSINRIHRSALGQLIICIIGILGDICYLLLNKNKKNIMNETVFLIGLIAVLFICISLLRVRKSLNYEVEENIS